MIPECIETLIESKNKKEKDINEVFHVLLNFSSIIIKEKLKLFRSEDENPDTT